MDGSGNDHRKGRDSAGGSNSPDPSPLGSGESRSTGAVRMRAVDYGCEPLRITSARRFLSCTPSAW